MNLLTEHLQILSIEYDANTLASFERYYELLIEWNNRFNLTAITERDDVIIKHFADSLYGYSHVMKASTVVDVGTGAGFPSLPLAIVCPHVHFYLVDSLLKRVTFLDHVVSELGLKNVTTVHSRAEEYARAYPHVFDVAVARAVSAMPTLLEYLIPLVRIGGKAVCYKSRNVTEELSACDGALEVLKCKVIDTIDYNIHNTDISRTLVVVSPFAKCKGIYPRGKNKPKTNPL